MGITVNVVPNQSTPFLINFDVIREYGAVIDYHCNRVQSHVLQHVALEMMPRERLEQHRAPYDAVWVGRWDRQTRAKQEQTRVLVCHSHDQAHSTTPRT